MCRFVLRLWALCSFLRFRALQNLYPAYFQRVQSSAPHPLPKQSGILSDQNLATSRERRHFREPGPTKHLARPPRCVREHSTCRCRKRTFPKTFSEFSVNRTTCRSCFLQIPPPAGAPNPRRHALLSTSPTNRSTNPLHFPPPASRRFARTAQTRSLTSLALLYFRLLFP